MKTGNRLINGFKKQTQETIWNYLDGLADRKDVYSEGLYGILPQLSKNKNTYIYVHNTCVVVVVMDPCGAMKEIADEEMINDEKPLYFTGQRHRISPVYGLSEAVRSVRHELETSHIQKPVWGVLLTESNIMNAYGMEEVWEEMGITVIDELENLNNREIRVNTDECLPAGKKVMDALISLTYFTEPTEEEMESFEQLDDDRAEDVKQSRKEEEVDEFEQLLRDFIDSLGQGESEGTGDDIDEDDDEELDDEEEDDMEDLEDEDDEEQEDERQSGSPFFGQPSGTVEQNNNVSVKVEILPPLANPRAELDKLVGCDDIKKCIDQLLALTRFNKMMCEAYPDIKQHEVALHSIFFGRPGTGKTTVCKIYGSLLHEAGVLSKGQVVVADRGTFIGTLWGDEERSVRQVVEMAQGGVLMIDEAYLLNTRNERDPSHMIIPLLLKMLADEKQRDIAVVLCGYKNEMMQLLDTNPGIPSRFPNRFEFRDFTIDELLEITRRRIKEYRYHFTAHAWQKFRNLLVSAYDARDPQSWGNARFIANQLEHIYIQHAQRCVKECPSDKSQWLTLTSADIQPVEVARPRPRIGF